MELEFERLPDSLKASKYKKTTRYKLVRDGLYTPPVKITALLSGWPKHERLAIQEAQLRGESEEEIRRLVVQLLDHRKKFGLDTNLAA